MAVKIRLSRFGKKKSPMYRIVATDSKKKRDGEYLENIGTYNSIKHQLVEFKVERLTFWVSQGAIVTDAVKKIKKTYGDKENTKQA